MPETVTVRFLWTLSLVREASRWHRRQTFWGRYGRWLLGLCAAGLIGFSLYAHNRRVAADADPDSDSDTEEVASPSSWYPWLWYGVPGYVALLFGLRYAARRRAIRRNYLGSAAKETEIEWVLSEPLVRMQFAYGKSEFSWQAFVKAVQTPGGLLLYPQPAVYNWLPKQAFASEADFEQVVKWIYANVPNFRHLG